MKIAQFILIFFFLCTTAVYAIGDEFGVRTLIGDDFLPPTTPTLLTATPVAQTQIDLSWGASADDFILGGYQVFRDATQIATTTLTTYSDTGLIASTTYTYFIRAYDSLFNISSSSNSIATTTFGVTPTSTQPIEDNNNGGNGPDVKLVLLEVLPSIYSVKLQWETNQYAQFELRWGRTSSYELGFVYTDLYKRENTTVITDLEPGTVYEYQLVSYDRDGDREVLSQGRFKTLTLPDNAPPANVTNLRANVTGNTVTLSWDNPTENDFSYVRIVRSHLFYPVDAYDGYIAYQGSRDVFTDKSALIQKDVQYYTVFAYDTQGNISSGAVVAARAPSFAQTPTRPSASSTPLQLSFEDVEFFQNNTRINARDVDADTPLTVRIAYEKLPEHLKTITVVLSHPYDRSLQFGFLLKINNDKTYYEATLGALREGGEYPAVLLMYDYEVRVLHTLEGSIMVTKAAHDEDLFGIPLTVKPMDMMPWFLLFWLLLILLLLLLLYKLVSSFLIQKKTRVAFGTFKTLSVITIVAVGIGGIAAGIFSITMIGTSIEERVFSASVMNSLPLPQTFEGVAILIVITLLCMVVLAALLSYLHKK